MLPLRREAVARRSPNVPRGIASVVFPKNNRSMYYQSHWMFVHDVFAAAGCDISYGDNLTEPENVCTFRCVINGKTVVFNISDDPILGLPEEPEYPSFKFHVNRDHTFAANIFPFSPISFYRWGEYQSLCNSVKYSARSDMVLNNQLPTGNALERRTRVANLLRARYGSQVDFRITSQRSFWGKFSRCLVSVCVPGYCNSMLDRGQLQSMAFGACTISPRLPEKLPYNQTLEPGRHYVICQDDYSDLVDQIEWCRDNRSKCVEIGQAAQSFFRSHLMPDRLVAWVVQHI
jgi:hypothetical protein